MRADTKPPVLARQGRRSAVYYGCRHRRRFPL